jgi:phosphoribosylanthranilate isomerase
MWIKICGVNDPETAAAIAALGSDAIGLNFYPPSPRRVSLETARAIAERIPAEIEIYGVFVEPSADFVRKAIGECRLDGVQIHAAAVDCLRGRGAIDPAQDRGRRAAIKRVRAFAVAEAGLAPLREYFGAAPPGEPQIDACLLDAHVAGLHGGTGRQAPWELIVRDYRRDAWPRLILAGGLRPENVAQAIETVAPGGVDVAGGVESSPGVKDLDRVRRFIEAARSATSSRPR